LIRTLIFAAALLVAAPAAASDATDIAAAVNASNDALNKNDVAGAAGYYAPEASIIDEFSPHLWTGPKAFAQWGADFGVYAAGQKMTDPWVTLSTPTFVHVNGDRAYIVFPADFAFKLAGKPTHEPGFQTFAMQKIAAKWKIAGWTWTMR